MFFKSFREKRRQENEYFDQLIEEAREEERLQLLAEESRWGEKWDHKIEALEFNEKEQELLSSFSEKVYCAQMAPEVFKDEVALSISTKLDLKPALETINPLCFLTSLANHHYVTEIRHYLKRNPRASVVDITCGLSTLFYQVYNKKLTWFNIDEDNILNLRNKLGLDDHKSIKQISITPPPENLSWLESIPYHKNKGLVLLLNSSPRTWEPQYLKTFLVTLQNHYPNSLVLLNCSGGRAGAKNDSFTFYSLNAKAPLHAWLTSTTTRIYTLSGLEKNLAENFKPKLRQSIKRLYRNGHQILVTIKF